MKLDIGGSAAAPTPQPRPVITTTPLSVPVQQPTVADAVVSATVPIPDGPRVHGQWHLPPPLLDNYYTGGNDVDLIYHKDAKNVVYSSDATMCDFSLPSDEDLIEMAWSLVSYMS